MEAPGQFAVRGGIVDIFALTEDAPWRIEFWDDEVDSIRSFDAESQRSLENLDELTLYPAAELNPEEQHCEGVSLLDYVKFFPSLVFLDEGGRLLERGETVEKEYLQNYENRMEKARFPRNQPKEIFTCAEMIHRLNHVRGSSIGNIGNAGKTA